MAVIGAKFIVLISPSPVLAPLPGSTAVYSKGCSTH